MIEKRRCEKRRRGEGDDRRGNRHGDRGAHESEPEHARHGDVVEDAEEDEGVAEREPGHDCDGGGARRDHAEPAQKALRPEAVPLGKDETDADDEEEAAGDRSREEPPAEVVLHVGGQEAEIAQVPGEVIDDHRRDGGAARRVDQRQARRGRRGGGGLHTH